MHFSIKMTKSKSVNFKREDFSSVSSQVPESHIQKRCHDLLEGKEDFGTVEDVYERLTEEFLQYNERYRNMVESLTVNYSSFP